MEPIKFNAGLRRERKVNLDTSENSGRERGEHSLASKLTFSLLYK
jgi:hypothetical protein